MAKAQKEIQDNKNWYKDRYQRVLVERRILIVITLAALACAFMTVLGIWQMTPLKSVEPFVIQVDQKSGITQTVDPLTARELTANEAINNFFLVQYIRAREAYNVNDLTRNYNIVRVMSEPNKVYRQFVHQAEPNNPASNAARLGGTGTRMVRLKSVSYLNPQTPNTQLVQVRMLIDEAGGTVGYSQQNKIALITFEYAKLKLTTEERYLNPLGFRILDYRVDEDTLSK